ncbi:hypothetical protein K432DRAFT_444448 [Lepidopterella palustris CBS 459.81]|uniref:Uncharacterized protein n=1 Tax=Lepidopterella palustris CBS 459.81 TaxID=1314670 RepID=A0A8E2E7D8_9PEZI|nr:hypothetical protein K432DRAFT_444448 [Lepidopterella palustris CBS 459.81]
MPYRHESPMSAHPPGEESHNEQRHEFMKYIDASYLEEAQYVDMSSKTVPLSSIRSSRCSAAQGDAACPLTSETHTDGTLRQPLTDKNLADYLQYLNGLDNDPVTMVQMRQEQSKKMMDTFKSLGVDLPDNIINKMTDFDGMGPMDRFLAEIGRRQGRDADGNPTIILGDGASLEAAMATLDRVGKVEVVVNGEPGYSVIERN